jgi:predicted phosphodiesterase
MRVAALYDIHGNLPALDAVLDDVRRAGVDAIVIGGDVVPGPMPRETVDRLQNLDVPAHFIHGNGDREILACLRGREMTTTPEAFRPVMRWVAAQLGPADAAAFATWPDTLLFEIDGIGEVLFCHATPRNDIEIFTRVTPDERVAPMFAGVTAPVVVCGHTHMQFDRVTLGRRIVNAGSVGMPFGEPGAYWLLLGSGIQFQKTVYDLERAAARIRETAYPGADQFASSNVLRPPSEADMLARFS